MAMGLLHISWPFPTPETAAVHRPFATLSRLGPLSDRPSSTTAGSRESAREGLRVRLGQVRFNGERTCWLFGRRQEDFEAVADLVTAIVARYPRLELLFTRSEERRGGKECGSTCRSWWSPYH